MNEDGRDWEQTASLESVQDVRLLALLHDLVEEDGRKGAAAALGVHRKTVAACVDTGTLSGRMRDALERFLRARDREGTAEPEAGDAEGSLEERVGALEEALRDCREELLATAEAEGRRLGDGVAEQARAVEGRLAALESRRAERGAASPAPVDGERQAAGRAHDRRHPQLVTVDPEPGEEGVYGEATPLIVDWRRVRTDRLEARDRLSRARTEERMRELEITMIGEFRLTLPPETHPWDDRARTDAVHLRTQALERVRGERIRAQRRRWVRRIVTLGLWWR